MKRGANAADALGRRIGFAFTDLARLDEALTHPSASSPARPHYQRLEFLGDRVLGLVVAEALFTARPGEAEGEIAPRLNALVRKETCAEIAAEIRLGDLLRLGKSESARGGKRKIAALGDAMEALIAAVYLDGGLDAARDVVLRLWSARIEAQGDGPPRDPKTEAQEWAQARGLEPPAYVEIARSGPDHAPRFVIEARLSTGASGRGEAGAKRAAERAAAAELLLRLGIGE